MSEHQPDFMKRNLLSTIRECLEEHRVDLRGEKGNSSAYLVQVEAASPLEKDFLDTYRGELDEFKLKLAKNLSGDRQTYGVLIDSDLKYRFAFNTSFADFDKKKGEIIFKTPEDILVESAFGKTDKPEISWPTPSSGSDWNDSDDSGTVFRYALVGGKRKKGKSLRFDDAGLDFLKPSLLDRVKNDYKNFRVLIKNGSEEKPFFLVNTSYETSILRDFLMTYCGGVDDFKERIARNSFGEGKSTNRYGLLFSEDLEIKFAFNTRFGRYNSQEKTINFLSPEDVLVGSAKILPVPMPIPKNRPKRVSPPITILYAVTGRDDDPWK